MKDFIQDLARKAASVLIENFGKDPALINLRNSAKEAVTVYDRMVDELIINEIKRHYPHHSLLTEESGFLKDDPDWLWVVDSLDGTGNFANSNPLFSVCIALIHNGELLLGAIYAPAINEFYLAERGNGAYLNSRRIRVSEISQLSQSYIFYCEGGEKDRARTGKIWNKIYPEVIDMRKLGSAGLEIAWVAAGKGETYFTTRIEPWDVAAGVLLIREAGGKVTNFDGSPWKLETSDLLFSNGKVHQKMLSLIRS